MKNKNNIIVTIMVALLVGGLAFYGGMQYQRMQRGNFAGQMANRNNGGFQGNRMFANGNRPVSGEIISQDDNSITVKMPDGSTKIVIISDKTTINKASAGAKTDLKTGERVTAFGTANSDGSMTAQNVSIGGSMMFRGPQVSGQAGKSL
jgi:cytochrome c biogenesis protein ResB